MQKVNQQKVQDAVRGIGVIFIATPIVATAIGQANWGAVWYPFAVIGFGMILIFFSAVGDDL